MGNSGLASIGVYIGIYIGIDTTVGHTALALLWSHILDPYASHILGQYIGAIIGLLNVIYEP